MLAILASSSVMSVVAMTRISMSFALGRSHARIFDPSRVAIRSSATAMTNSKGAADEGAVVSFSFVLLDAAVDGPNIVGALGTLVDASLACGCEVFPAIWGSDALVSLAAFSAAARLGALVRCLGLKGHDRDRSLPR